MTIQATVQSQITAANAWASAARESAAQALEAITDVDIPSVSIGAIPFTPLGIITPETVPQPGEVAVDVAPDLATITNIVAPESPVFDNVSLGDLLAITIPEAPAVEFPVLNFDAPVYEIDLPENWSFTVSNILITDDPLVQAIKTKLSSNISNGGTGLSAAVEDAIWNRDLEREEQRLSDSLDKATTVWSRAGWSLPDGLLAHSLAELQVEYMNKSLDRSREIAVKQAELEQTNLFKSIELGISLIARLIELLIRYEELVLRSQEDIAKFANEYIDLQIRTYVALVEAYKAKAVVLEAIVRSSLGKVEVFRAQIDAQRLIGEVNKQTVEVYVEQLRSHTVLADRYRMEVEAMTAKLGAERTKIEANKLQFDAWAKKADVALAQYAGRVDIFRSVSQQNISTADLQGRQAEATVRANLAATELSIKATEVTNRSLQNAAAIRVEAAKGVAAAAAAMAAGAMAGVTTGASMSYGENNDVTTI